MLSSTTAFARMFTLHTRSLICESKNTEQSAEIFTVAKTDILYPVTAKLSNDDLVSLAFTCKFMAERIFNDPRHKKQLIERLKLSFLPRLKGCIGFYSRVSVYEFRKLKYIIESVLDREYFIDNRTEIFEIFCGADKYSENHYFIELFRLMFDRGLLTPEDITRDLENSLTLACRKDDMDVFTLLVEVLGHSAFMECLHKDDYYKILIATACRKGSHDAFDFLLGFQWGTHTHCVKSIKEGLKYCAQERKTPILKSIFPHARGMTIITLLNCLVPVVSNSANTHYLSRIALSSYFALNGYFAYKKYTDDYPDVIQYITLEDIRPCFPDLLETVCRRGYTNMLEIFIWMGLTLEEVRRDDNLLLRTACASGTHDIVRILHEFGLSYSDFINAAGGRLLVDVCGMIKRQKLISEILRAIPLEVNGEPLRLNYIRAGVNLALRTACVRGRIDNVKELMRFGITADDFRANDNEIIKYLCNDTYHWDMLELVLQHLSADDVCDEPLFIACSNQTYNLVEKLIEKICECKEKSSYIEYKNSASNNAPTWHEYEPPYQRHNHKSYVIYAITANENRILNEVFRVGSKDILKLFIEYGLGYRHVMAYNYKVIKTLNDPQNRVRDCYLIKDVLRRKLGMSEEELQIK